ncbi:MAG: 4-hydroxythreonine-4-phosphate dehydrogenase PdxA [Bacteroidota bacterium]|nr:4-hydroxythreonine-4-phosphate dehydrogenase PdxA [Bacteroidota bacterium]
MRILITCGDTNGIGLELFLRAAGAGRLQPWNGMLWLCAPRQAVSAYAQMLAARGLLPSWEVGSSLVRIGGATIPLVPIEEGDPAVEFGMPTAASGRAAYAALRYAGEALVRGEYQAVVTLPVSKHALRLAGFPYPGQTEFFGAVARQEPLMILACPVLRVALVTIHEPIARVAARISHRRVVETIERFATSLRQDFAVATPRIAVLGLNPHAGEQGAIGTEEEEVIRPAIAQCRQRGIDVDGPYPADGFFARQQWRAFDGVLAQYHDQGLIPLKMLAQGRGVNITAGLPFVRTSPDHGTAYDLVGTGRADDASLVEAIGMAQYLAHNRQHFLRHVSPLHSC